MQNTYSVSAESVGKLRKIIVRHDDSGWAPAWYLDKVEVKDHTGLAYNFSCNSWFQTSDKDRPIKILREDRLPPKEEDVTAEKSEEVVGQQMHDYNVTFYTGKVFGGGT